MNLKEAEAVIRIAEERNITKAADKLFVTPSALNQLLSRVEADLGTPLFIRSRAGCTITPAGEIYLRAAREVCSIRKAAYDEIHDLADSRNGTLNVGLPSEHGTEMFLSVYPMFHELYPKVSLYMHEAGTKRQQELLSQGALDISFMNVLDSQRTIDEYEPIVSEELLIIVPSSHPATSQGVLVPGSPFPELDLRLLNHESFGLPTHKTTLRQWIDQEMTAAGCVPHVLFENSLGNTTVRMVAAGYCCGMASDYYYHPEIDGVSYFTLHNHPKWDFCACYKKGTYLSKPAREYIRLTREYWVARRKALGLQ